MEEDQVLVVNDVPADKVDAVIEGFKNAGATEVTKSLQPNGKFTVRATFPN
jgi:hypothetical protein